MSNLVLVRLETVLVSVQDRFMVCAKRNIGSKIILEAQVDARFIPFGDNANLDAR
jgi:hypothetical protein